MPFNAKAKEMLARGYMPLRNTTPEELVVGLLEATKFDGEESEEHHGEET